jgi:hypothetical protein
VRVDPARLRYAGSPFAAIYRGNPDPASGSPSVPSPGSARKARRQMGRVLLFLAVLDASVVVSVVVLAELSAYLGLTTLAFLGLMLLGIAIVLGVRVGMAVRLRQRVGEL